MDETNKPTEIDYYTYEESMSRAERHVKRWVMAFVIVFLSFVATNVGWVIYECSFEDVVTVTQDATADGNSDISLQNVGGDYHGGESEADNN